MTENHALIDMRGIVKSFNVGTEGELTVLPGCDFQPPPGGILPRWSAPPVPASQP